jgi:hypothetical protein
MPIHTINFSGHPDSSIDCVFSVCEAGFPKHGWCGIKFRSGIYFEGFTTDGRPSGKGTLFHPSGYFIEGSWIEGSVTLPFRPHNFLVGSLVQVSQFTYHFYRAQGACTSQCSFFCCVSIPYRNIPTASRHSLHRHGQVHDSSIVL